MRGLLKRFQTFALLPEWVLIQRAKLGEKEAFGKLYEIYVDRLYRYIYFRVGNNRELAEDLVQSAFMKAWEKLETFKKGSFQAWLYTITRNTLIDHVRSTRQHMQIDETYADETQDVEEDVLQKLEAERVMEAVTSLTDEQQEIIVLRFANGLSYKEIAQATGKKEDAIRAMQYRGIKELKRILNS